MASLISNARACLPNPMDFSNNVRGFLGPPDFEEAIMEVNAGDKAVRIALIYHDLTGTYDEEPEVS